MLTRQPMYLFSIEQLSLVARVEPFQDLTLYLGFNYLIRGLLSFASQTLQPDYGLAGCRVRRRELDT